MLVPISVTRNFTQFGLEAYRELSFDLLKTWPCKDGQELGEMLKYVLFANFCVLYFM